MGVLLAGMIAGNEKGAAIGELGGYVVAERWFARRQGVSGGGVGSQESVEGDAAQSHNDRQIRKKFNLAGDVGAAGGQLIGSEFVLRRSAARGGGNQGVLQLEAIAGAGRFRLVCKSSSVQSPKQPIPAAVAGKHASGAVTAVGRRRQTDYQQAGLWVTEGSQRPTPIIFIPIHPPLDTGRFLPPIHESGTGATGDNLLLHFCNSAGVYNIVHISSYEITYRDKQYRVIRLSLRGAQRRGNLVEVEHVPGNHHCYGDEIATLRSQ